MTENPAYDVDPKWADLVREKANLPHDLLKRVPSLDRKKGPGRPPILASPPTSQAASISSAASSLPTSLASNLPFSSLASAAAGLSAINPSLLSGLSMGNFDPKSQLLLPFAGLPNMSALSSMGGLGNMNLIANLASLGMGGFAGMDGGALSGDHTGTTASSSGGGNASSNSKSGKARKQDSGGGGGGSNSNTPAVSTASSLSSQIPFFFPNPNLLYTPLSLTGLNPFSLQPGSLPPTYDLSLLNGGLSSIASSSGVNTPTTSRHKTSTSGGRSTMATTTSSTTSSSASSGQRQSSSRSATPHLQQFQLPGAENHLLDSLTKARGAGDASLSKRNMREMDHLRSLMSNIPPFNFPGLSADGKKLKDQDIMESLHSKFSTDMFARIPSVPHMDERKSSHPSTSELMEKLLKRSAQVEPNVLVSGERPSKRAKESGSCGPAITTSSSITVPAMSKLFSNSNLSISSDAYSSGMDLSNERKEPTAPSDVGATPVALSLTTARSKNAEARLKTPEIAEPTTSDGTPVDDHRSKEERKAGFAEVEETATQTVEDPEAAGSVKMDGGGELKEASAQEGPSLSAGSSSSSQHDGQRSPSSSLDKEDGGANKKRKPRNKKNPIAPEEAIERKNLRSSAGRAAAVAAARAARAAAAAQDEPPTDDKKEDESFSGL